jgi:hypothetical protein
VGSAASAVCKASSFLVDTEWAPCLVQEHKLKASLTSVVPMIAVEAQPVVHTRQRTTSMDMCRVCMETLYLGR